MRRPHIFFKRGYWRVSPKPKPYYLHVMYQPRWDAAHDRVNLLNQQVRA